MKTLKYFLLVCVTMVCLSQTGLASTQTKAMDHVVTTQSDSPKLPILTPININVDEMDKLMQLPGVGAKRAQAIIDFRTSNGAFQTISDLAKIKGISPRFVEKYQKYLTVG